MEEEKKEMIENVEHCIKNFNGRLVDCIAVGNLLKAYKEKEIERKWDMEIISKLSFELGKYQAKSEEDEAVIEEMAKYIKEPYFLNIFGSRKPKIEIIKEYFRSDVKGEKE